MARTNPPCVYTHTTVETDVAMEPEDFELPSGQHITVRPLTGMEVALISKRNAQLADDPDTPGGVAIQIGLMLGETKIRAAEAAGTEWLRTHSAADFLTLGNKIEALSGYGPGATKSAVD